MRTHLIRLVTALIASAAIWPPASAQNAPRTPCTLVVGQGRYPAEDADENAGWDRINATLATQVAAHLSAQGERTLRLSLPVVYDDVAGIVETLLANARREGCDRIVETSLFIDAGEQTLVARLRAYPVRREAAGARIGDPWHVSQRDYPNTQRNRDRLQPAALGRELADDYLTQPATARSEPR